MLRLKEQHFISNIEGVLTGNGGNKCMQSRFLQADNCWVNIVNQSKDTLKKEVEVSMSRSYL